MTVETELAAAEAELYRAMIAKDFKALERILAPDVLYVHSTGVIENKREYLAGVDKGLYEYEAIKSRDIRIRSHGDMAVMNGILDMVVGEIGRPKGLIQLIFVLLWARQAGAWRLQFRQTTRLQAKA